jgi:hypothetical protein
VKHMGAGCTRARCTSFACMILSKQSSCTNSIDKGISRSYVPLNKPRHELIKVVQGLEWTV